MVMYVKYGAGAKPFNKGTFSFLIAFARQLEQALEERPDELEDTLGALANGLAYLTGEDSGLLPGDGGESDGIDDDISPTSGVQDEVAADGSAGPLRGRHAGATRNLERAMARVAGLDRTEAFKLARLGHVQPEAGHLKPLAKRASMRGGKSRGTRKKARK